MVERMYNMNIRSPARREYTLNVSCKKIILYVQVCIVAELFQKKKKNVKYLP